MKLQRVRDGIKQSLLICTALGIVLMTAIYVTAPMLSTFFTSDPVVVEGAVHIARFQCLFFLTWECIQVFSSVLRAVGDSIIPMLLTGFGVCGLRMVWVLWITPLLPHQFLYTVCCYQISWVFTSLLFVGYYYFLSPLNKMLKMRLD